MQTIENLKIKIFADGADKAGMLEMYKKPFVKGFTTNPTLMRKDGVTDYCKFAKNILQEIRDRPISFEVFSDDLSEMDRQARIISGWGKNVFVKIPITNTKGEYTTELVKNLSRDGIKLNVTALLTLHQVRETYNALSPETPAYISVFAGRIADTGRNPEPIMAAAVALTADNPNIELIWASPRELLNIFQAEQVGCHVITATNDILNKLKMLNKDLDELSLDTVKMFRNDAQQAGYQI